MIKVNVYCVPLVKRLLESAVQSVKIVALEDMVLVAKHANLVSIAHLRQMIPRHVLTALLEDINPTMDKQAVFRVHQENTNTLKEKKHAQIVRWDVRRILLATINVNVCCVLSVKRLHEMAVQSVKIVALEDMVMVAKNAKLVNIVPRHWTILQHVSHAVSEDTKQTMDKQAVFRAHQANTNISKEKKHA